MNIAVNNKTKSRISVKSCRERITLFARRKEITLDNLSIAFVDDAEMEEVNNKYLNHEGTTDIITFDYGEQDSAILDGELIICTDQAKRQARQYKVKLENEISRLIFHGLLHLSGFDDHTEAEQAIMTQQEEIMLLAWSLHKKQ